MNVGTWEFKMEDFWKNFNQGFNQYFLNFKSTSNNEKEHTVGINSSEITE